MKKIFLIMIALSLSILAQENATLSLASIFSDDMVLQQKANCAVWGISTPGSEITVTASWGAKSKVKSDEKGNWLTKIKTPKAGGPYTLIITDKKSKIEFKDILIGEVWLASGQSNMEMPLRGFGPVDVIMNSETEIRNANNPKIRMFTAIRTTSPIPQFNVTGSWQKLNSTTAPSFSATAYFFAKHLFEKLNVPIGIIHSSWGGTPIESWIEAKYLADFPQYQKTIESFEGADEKLATFNAWLSKFSKMPVKRVNGIEDWTNLDFNDSNCMLPIYDDAKWGTMNLPGTFERSEIGEFDGAVWFRKQIEVPETFVGKDLILNLGPIDDCDVTFVNGIKVGGFEEDGHYQSERIYTIPKEIINNSIITIAVRVLDFRGGGGIYGSPDKLNLKIKGTEETKTISLAGQWKYLPVALFMNDKFYVFGSKNEMYFTKPKVSISIGSHSATALYNGMIAPLVPYTIKGAIWYQGESNCGRAEEYKLLKTALLKNWRERFNVGDFPFYYVQIAPYRYSNGTNSQLLREAQFLSLKNKNTGMAVTLDIGDPGNIHPANKQDVGKRLALWALAKNYGKKNVYSGPLYKSMKSEYGKIILEFEHHAGGLELKLLNGENNFNIAGEDKVFKKAVVVVEGTRLKLFNQEIANPVAVRYAWSETAEATLFNKAGLPASTFRTDDWKD